MDENEKRQIEKEVAQRYHLHIRYILLVCLLICLFITLMVPKHVTEEAFQNFSFAATITSIVLAVVSIVYSFYSSGGIATSIGEMKQVEKDLEDEIKDIPDLKRHVSETVDDLKTNILEAIHADRQASDSKTEELTKSVHDIHDELAGLTERMQKGNNEGSDDNQDNLFEYQFNSFNGNLLMFALKKSVERNNASFKLMKISQIIGQSNLAYCRGYLVALFMCNRNRFSYDSDDLFETITVTNIDRDYFQFDDMESIILENEQDQERVKSYQSKMKEITNYFDGLNSSTTTEPGVDSKD